MNDPPTPPIADIPHLFENLHPENIDTRPRFHSPLEPEYLIPTDLIPTAPQNSPETSPSSSPQSNSMQRMEDQIEERLQDMRLERCLYEARMSALHNACTNSLSLNGAFTFPTFKGDETEDVNEFISKFVRAANFCGWNEDKQTQALPLYFKGNASVWFNSLHNRETITLPELLEALTSQFASNASNWRLRQNLEQRKQQPSRKIN